MNIVAHEATRCSYLRVSLFLSLLRRWQKVKDGARPADTEKKYWAMQGEGAQGSVWDAH